MRFDRRISRRSFLAAAGVSAAALALTACGGSSSTAASTAASTGASSAAGTAAGGTLNIMLETEVQSLDPQIATDGTSFEVIADYTDGLMQMDTDGAAVPAIAESCDISEDGKTYTFHLRDAKWSNGDAVTAADFVFGWQRAVDPANASEYSYMLSDIGQVVNAAEIIAGEKPVTDLGVTAVDDKTLEVQLNVPVSYFLSLMYFPTFYPVNEAFFNTCADTFGTSPDTVQRCFCPDRLSARCDRIRAGQEQRLLRCRQHRAGWPVLSGHQGQPAGSDELSDRYSGHHPAEW